MEPAMRRLFPVTFLCLFTALVFANDKPLRLGLEHWPPYMDRFHEDHGAAAELVMTALHRAGYQFSINYDNWSHTLQGTELGVFDIIVAGWYTEPRTSQFVYSKPYLYNRISFIKRKDDNIQFNSLADLRGELIGTVNKYAYGEEFDRSNLLIKLPVNHLVQNLSLLQQGKIDLTLDDELVIRHQLRTYMPGTADQFAFLEKPVTVRGLHILVSRKRDDHEKIVADFDRVVQEMRLDGSFEKVLQKYESGYRFLTETD